MYFVSFVQNLVYDLQTIIRSATNINYRFVMVILHNSVDIPFLFSVFLCRYTFSVFMKFTTTSTVNRLLLLKHHHVAMHSTAPCYNNEKWIREVQMHVSMYSVRLWSFWCTKCRVSQECLVLCVQLGNIPALFDCFNWFKPLRFVSPLDPICTVMVSAL